MRSMRNEIERVLRAWDGYERSRDAHAIIDYDCYPTEENIVPASNRLEVLRQFTELKKRADRGGEAALSEQIDAHIAYLRALLGEHWPLGRYIKATQGCYAKGWPKAYITECGDRARDSLSALGIEWNAETGRNVMEAEGILSAEEAAGAIREAASELEPVVRGISGTSAHYELTITVVDIDAYWGYWIDGVGQQARLRLNLHRGNFTRLQARSFALHEVLGHALQGASFAARCANEDVPWIRLMSVHAPQQVLFEGLAYAFPLFVVPNDKALVARVRLEHYVQLVQAELHLALNAGVPADECATHARTRIPYWTDEHISDILTDRGTNPLLRSYMWAYVAGTDWFVNLADSGDIATISKVFHAAYIDPLTPANLSALWPAGPSIGGSGEA